MKIPIDSICVKCPLCQNRVSIVDYDKDTGETEVLYYRGECKLGHEDAGEYCAIKQICDSIYNTLSELAELIAEALHTIIDTFIDIFTALAVLEKQNFPIPTTPQMQYNIVPRGDMRIHRVQYRRKGYHKHRQVRRRT